MKDRHRLILLGNVRPYTGFQRTGSDPRWFNPWAGCGIHAERCPTGATGLQPMRGGLLLSDINDEACTVCGADIGACPADAAGAEPRVVADA